MQGASRRIQTGETPQRPSRFRWPAAALLVLLILTPVGLYAWRYVYNPCEVEAVEKGSVSLETQLNVYDRVYQVAVTAFRTAPDHPVNTLKQIFMDTQETPVPACMKSAKAELLNYMGTVIYAFDAYRDGEDDAAVVDLIRQSNLQYDSFYTELEAVKECAPYCFP